MDDIYEEKIVIFAIVMLALVGLFLLLLFVFFVKQKNLVLRKKEQAELNYKKEIIKTQAEIQKETMKHIGREIHDNVGQKLTLSSLYLQQLIFEKKAPQIHKNINGVITIIDESLQELRHLSKSLTDNTIENNSISELIEEECKKLNELKTHKINFINTLYKTSNSYQTKSVILRVVQEFLQNSIKHAQCKNVEISLFNSDKNLVLMLKDDGKGFDVKNVKPKGIGLKNMQKRVEIIKGTFALESKLKKGTMLTIKIPVS